MNLIKAETLSPLLSFLSLIPLILCSLACGGGGQTTNNGVLELQISGSVDESIFPSGLNKTRQAPGSLSGLVTNLDNTDETWSVSINGNQYSSTIIRKNNIKIEIFLNQRLFLSRVFNNDESNVSDLTANINTLTHLQAQTALAQISEGTSSSLSEAQISVNQSLFGKSELDDSDYNITLLAENNPAIAVIMSTYAQLFNFTDFNLIRTSLIFINSIIENPEVSSIGTDYLNELNSLSDSQTTIATIIATAHESAKNADNNPIDVGEYASIANNFSLEALTAALEAVRIQPVFPSIDSVNAAGAGILFNYDFPAATTEDRQGLASEGYQTIWLSTPPTGIISNSGNGGLNLKFIPSSDDIGQTFEYQISIKGANNAGPVTESIEIHVYPPEITSNDRKRIFDEPIAGPVIDDEYLYLISTGTDGTFLDKYPQSEIQSVGGATFLSVLRWLLPDDFTDIKSMAIHNDLIYLAGGFSGTLAFDKNYSVTNEDEPTYSSNLLGATHLEIFNEQLFALDTSFTPVLSRANLDISSIAEETSLESLFIQGSTANLNTVVDDYLYISGNSSTSVYIVDSFGELLEVDQLDSSFHNLELLEDAEELETPFALLDGDSITRFDVVNERFSQVSSINFDSSQLSHQKIGNGTIFYTPNPNTPSMISAYSLTSDSFSSVISSSNDEDIYYSGVSDKLKFLINNIPEGIESGKSGAWIYTVGAGNATSFDEGFIRAFKVEPNLDE